LEDFWHLQQFDWLAELTAAEKDHLRRQSTRRTYRSGETIFSPVSHPQSVYLLEHGLVRIYRLSASGAETTFGYIRPGEVFGELAVFSDRPRESYASAASAACVWRLARETMTAVLAKHPGIAIAISKQVGSRMKRIESRVEALVFRSVPSRLASILLELAEDFGRREANHLILDLQINQQELATLIGASRQAVNTSLRALQRDGIVRRDGRRLTLLRLMALRRLRDHGTDDGRRD
jgi:CRP-like cAMP-binding protein